MLLEPGFGPHGEVETTLSVGGLPCHVRETHTLEISLLIDKQEKVGDAVKLLWSADSCYRRGNREWNTFFHSPVIEDVGDSVKT